MELPTYPDPVFEVPVQATPSLEGMNVGDKVNGTAKYEIVEKDEHGVTIKLTHLTFNNDKRIY